MKIWLLACLLCLASSFAVEKIHHSKFEINYCTKLLIEELVPHHIGDLEYFKNQSVNYLNEKYHVVMSTTNQTYYRFHSEEQYYTGQFYSWLTDYLYEEDQEIRNKLALLTEWGNTLDYVTEFFVPAGTEMSVGVVGPQQDGKGEYRPGGGYQALVNSSYLLDHRVSTTKRTHK